MLFLSSCPSKQWVSDCHNINPRLLPSILLDEPVTTTAPRRVALRNDSASDSNKILWLWFWSSSCVELPRLRISYRTHTNWSNREASASTGFREVDGLWRGVPETEDRRTKTCRAQGPEATAHRTSRRHLFLWFTHTHTPSTRLEDQKHCHPQKNTKKSTFEGVTSSATLAALLIKLNLKRRRTCFTLSFSLPYTPLFHSTTLPLFLPSSFGPFSFAKKKKQKWKENTLARGKTFSWRERIRFPGKNGQKCVRYEYLAPLSEGSMRYLYLCSHFGYSPRFRNVFWPFVERALSK